jgi:hypothetical protein
MATASQRMAREKDDSRYEGLAKSFDEMRVEQDAANRRVEELSARPNTDEADESPEQKVERLMEVLDELATVASDEAVRQRIRPLLLRLGIWIGLDFEAAKLGKREVRRLRRSVIAFDLAANPTLRAPRGVAGGRRSIPVPREAMAPGTSARTNPTPEWSSLVPEVMSGRHDSNVRPLRPERSALARLSYAPMGATNEGFRTSRPSVFAHGRDLKITRPAPVGQRRCQTGHENPQQAIK